MQVSVCGSMRGFGHGNSSFGILIRSCSGWGVGVRSPETGVAVGLCMPAGQGPKPCPSGGLPCSRWDLWGSVASKKNEKWGESGESGCCL